MDHNDENDNNDTHFGDEYDSDNENCDDDKAKMDNNKVKVKINMMLITFFGNSPTHASILCPWVCTFTSKTRQALPSDSTSQVSTLAAAGATRLK